MSDLAPDRRHTANGARGRPKGGRRISDPILDLSTHPAAFVGVQQLAAYWCFHPQTLLNWIRTGRLAAFHAGEYRIRTSDALALERDLYRQRKCNTGNS